jgi:hypothetical protein
MDHKQGDSYFYWSRTRHALFAFLIAATFDDTIKDRERAWEPSTVVVSTVAVVDKLTK